MADKDNVHAGHREKRKKTFLYNRGFKGWQEHEVLEYLLFYALPRVNTNIIAHQLIDACGGFERVFTAPRSLLKSVDGVGDKVCDYLYMIGGLIEYCRELDVREKNMIAPGKSLKYFKNLFRGKTREHMYMICLDIQGNVIREKLLSEGNFETTDINIINIIRTAVSADAAYVVLAHNHPSGALEPSIPDITVTHVVEDALKSVGIGLRDHIIVTNEGCIGIKEYEKNKGEKRIIHKFGKDIT